MASVSILFVAATRAEWHAACPAYAQGDAHTSLHEQCIHPFTAANGHECGVLITGVGPVNAAMALAKELEGARKARLVFNIGLAGSFDLTRAPLYSHWHVVHETYVEYGLVTGEKIYADAEALGFPQWQGNDTKPRVWNSINIGKDAFSPQTREFMAKTLNKLPLHGDAHSVTAAGVTVCAQRAAALQRSFHTKEAAYPMVLLENMEGFALALVCARYGLPFVQVRTVSNAVGTRAHGTFDFQGAMGAMQDVIRPLLCA